MKVYLHVPDSIVGTLEIDLPDDPLEAARTILDICDEYSGNSLNYPSLMTESEHREFEEELAA